MRYILKPATSLLVLFLSTFTIIAQQTVIGNAEVLSGMNGDLIYGTNKLKGHPYLLADWSNCRLTDHKGFVREIEKAKFDVSSHKLLVLHEGKEIWVNDHQIASFEIRTLENPSTTFVKLVYKDAIHYAEAITQGDISLFRIYNKTFVQPRPTDNFTYGSDGDLQPYFKDITETLVAKYKDGDQVVIKSNGKDLDKIFDRNMKSKIQNFQKNNKYTGRTVYDLGKYLDALSDSL